MKTELKYYPVLAFAFLILFCSCSDTKILKLGSRKYFRDHNFIGTKLGFKLMQSVSYRPEISDSNYTHTLLLTVIDTSAFKEKKIINLATDTSIVKSLYNYATETNFTKEKQNITGTLTLLEWNTRKVTVKMNLVVNDLSSNKKWIYKGKRTFVYLENN